MWVSYSQYLMAASQYLVIATQLYRGHALTYHGYEIKKRSACPFHASVNRRIYKNNFDLGMEQLSYGITVTNDNEYILVVITNPLLSYPRDTTRFQERITHRVPRVYHELLTRSEHLTPGFFVWFVLIAQFCFYFFIGLFCLLTIAQFFFL